MRIALFSIRIQTFKKEKRKGKTMFVPSMHFNLVLGGSERVGLISHELHWC